MMISKTTFVSMITTIMITIAETRKFCAAHHTTIGKCGGEAGVWGDYSMPESV